ncbi:MULTISPECIES: carotenoid oxygenase family protein [Rhodococcus]|uniref:Dioxygenase n=1 Tax=Rhodococcus opacus TaxID=37919 RepID=A0AAX3Y9P7_RHOOP|nr:MULTISPECIES: carotenoid oxygenase family protein [Rhodococcus]NHU41761.1 carotenoid oxygenase family protein [Rhodococcus sp. A14]MCZ4586315.1 carotenoid oxygenase family protein [Rhodococcus opacus]MDI9940473.1 carotenoid oxygenase family protein [Rhodococcus sp. IEGM 1351]UZG52994.1 carotenoid oxygenase family protein [Rhodococcus opacus]WLF44769.1 carotenoid oxygenase family protein [Rhodococcus opacus]
MGYPLPQEARLTGPFQPMRFEATVDECIVTHGEIPKDLAGGFYRTGPTWKRPTRQGTNGLLGMDGMVQGLVLENGRADFRNRWVRTPKYQLEEQHGRGMFEWTDGDWHDWRTYGYGDVKRDQYTCGVPQGTNNVNIFPFAGEMVASGEQGGPPIALDPITLETKGIVNWSPKLSPGIHAPTAFGDNSFTAHPKWDHETGVLYGWAYRDTAPYVTVHVVHPDGAVESRELWDAPYNTVAHDIWLTPEWMVMPFQPMLIDKKRITERELSVFGWDPELPIVIALIPRHDPAAPVRYITTDIEPQYIMHTLSANVSGNILTLDGPIFNRPPFPFEQDFAAGDDVALFFSIAKSALGRWTIDLNTGQAKSEQLSDRPSELPKVDERFYGKGYRWGYQVGGVVKKGGMKMNSLVVTDMQTLSDQEFQIRSDEPAAVLEGTFAPRHKDSPEGDGYIIVPVSWWAEKRGEFQIFDTHDITQGPICKIELPFMMGWTPHGHWMDFR